MTNGGRQVGHELTLFFIACRQLWRAYSSVALSVIEAFSTLDTGQFALASSASFTNSSPERPGTLPCVVSAIVAMRQPPPSCSMVRSALVCSVSGGCPAPLRRNASAIVKQPACAAAMSSSGLVPLPSPNRAVNEYGVSASVPLWVVRAPRPSLPEPLHAAVAFLLIVAMSRLQTRIGASAGSRGH